MKLSELYRLGKTQGKTEACRFMRQMKRAGLKLEFYQGRSFWTGPTRFGVSGITWDLDG
jgi:hypothetical protein